MSFQEVVTRNIDLVTINGKSYPPAVLPASIPLNSVVTGTGLAYPNSVIQPSGILAYVASGPSPPAGSTVIDMDPVAPGTAGFTYVQSGPLGMVNSNGGQAIVATTISGAQAVLRGGNPNRSIYISDAGTQIQDRTGSFGASGQVLIADGSNNCLWGPQGGGGGSSIPAVMALSNIATIVAPGASNTVQINLSSTYGLLGYNGTTSMFTTTTSGLYEFNISCELSGGNAGDTLQTIVDGTPVDTIRGFDRGARAASFIYSLGAGENFNLLYTNNGVLNVSVTMTWLSIKKIQ